ncbi:hypothetical protein [Streptomyces sp. ATCC 21386]|nr:hypothetical protein [Streptomyces sp. ATCC 21386]
MNRGAAAFQFLFHHPGPRTAADVLMTHIAIATAVTDADLRKN